MSGLRATVFGATGFVGRYVVNKLGKQGSAIRLPYRGDEVDNRHLKLAGDLGVVNFVPTSIRSPEEIASAIDGSNVVINLLGKHFETMRFSYDDVNRTFPGVLAEICANQGVERFVHVSALDANFDSPSSWARSKAAGEAAVREAFPAATILRPATMFGDEDRFLNRIAKLTQLLPFYPLVDAETTRQQPVYCDDVAAAIMEVVQSSKHQGKTLDLAGPKTYTNREIFDYVFTQIVEPSNAYAVPRSVGFAMASAMSLIPNPWMTLDGVRRTTVDICKPEGTPGFEELGITPTPMEDIADRYLVRFRKTSLFVEDGAVISQEK